MKPEASSAAGPPARAGVSSIAPTGCALAAQFRAAKLFSRPCGPRGAAFAELSDSVSKYASIPPNSSNPATSIVPPPSMVCPHSPLRLAGGRGLLKRPTSWALLPLRLFRSAARTTSIYLAVNLPRATRPPQAALAVFTASTTLRPLGSATPATRRAPRRPTARPPRAANSARTHRARAAGSAAA